MAQSIATAYKTGAIASSTGTSLTMSGTGVFASTDVDRIIYINDGEGKNQYRRITAFTSSTVIQIDYPFDVSALRGTIDGGGNAFQDKMPAAGDTFSISYNFTDLEGLAGYADTWTKQGDKYLLNVPVSPATNYLDIGTADTNAAVVLYDEVVQVEWDSRQVRVRKEDATDGARGAIILGRVHPGFETGTLDFHEKTVGTDEIIGNTDVVYIPGTGGNAGQVYKNMSGASITVDDTTTYRDSDDWSDLNVINGYTLFNCFTTWVDGNTWPGNGFNGNTGNITDPDDPAVGGDFGTFILNGGLHTYNKTGTNNQESDLTSVTGRMFFRMYQGDDLSIVRFWECIFEGPWGGRVRGEKSCVLDCTYKNGSNTLGTITPSSSATTSFFGAFKGNILSNKGQGLYIWLTEGANTVVTDLEVKNIYESLITMASSSEAGSRRLRLRNFNVDQLGSELSREAVFITPNSQNSTARVFIEQEVDVNIVDSTLAPVTDDSKLVWEDGSADVNQGEDSDGNTVAVANYSTNDGAFPTQTLLRWTSGQLPNSPRSFSDGIDFADYKFAVVSYDNEIQSVSNSLDGKVDLTLTVLPDNNIEANYALAAFYNSLETAQNVYDRAKAEKYDDPYSNAIGEKWIEIQNGDTLVQTAANPNVELSFSHSASSTLTLSATTLTIKLDNATPYDGNIILNNNSVRFLDPITGGVDIGGDDGVIFWANNFISDGDTIVDTTESLIGTMEVQAPAARTYTIANADVSGLTINRESGDTGAVTILLSGTTGTATAGTGVTLVEQVSFTLDLPFDYDSTASTYATAQSADGTLFGDATTTVDTTVSDTPVFNVQVSAGSTAYFAIVHDGIKPVRMNGTTNQTVSATILTDNIVDSTLDIDAAANADLKTVLGSGMAAVVNIGDSLQDIIIRFAGNASAITLDADQSKRAVWEIMKTSVYVSSICELDISPDFIDFNEYGVVLEDYTETLFDKVSSSGIYTFSMEVVDQGGVSRYTDVDSNTTLTEIRFKDKATNIVLPDNVMSDIVSLISTEIKPDLINLGLGVPLLNDAGDGFETSPNLPS